MRDRARRHLQHEPTVSSHGHHRSKALPISVCFAALATCIWLVWFFFFSASDVQVEVTGLSWERKIAVEDFAPRQSGAWKGTVPSDAYNEQETRKVHHYNKVQTGTKVVRNTSDRGASSPALGRNARRKTKGTASSSEPVTVFPSTKRNTTPFDDIEPVYRDDPVYETWVDYTVNRWKFSRWITASGNNHDAHWPETQIHPAHSAIPNIGNERLGERTEHYTVRLREMNSDEPRVWNETVPSLDGSNSSSAKASSYTPTA